MSATVFCITANNYIGLLLSAVVEQNTDLVYRILFSNIRILARKSRRIEQIMSEAEEIELHPNNVNGVDDYYLSRSRKPVGESRLIWGGVLIGAGALFHTRRC